jgi:hypothetical protein
MRRTRRSNAALLFGAEHAIARVAEARNDIAVVVEPFINRRGPDLNLRMRFCQPFDPLGRGEKADEADVLHSAPLEAVDRGDR